MVKAEEDPEQIKQNILQKIIDPEKSSMARFLCDIRSKPSPRYHDAEWWNARVRWPGSDLGDPFYRGIDVPDTRWIWQFNNTAIFPIPANQWFAEITDYTNTMCADVMINALECVEYYGAKRGLQICGDYWDDYYECTNRTKQMFRGMAIRGKRRERFFEYLAGKREWDTVYSPMPPPHSYHDPCPNPKDKLGYK